MRKITFALFAYTIMAVVQLTPISYADAQTQAQMERKVELEAGLRALAFLCDKEDDLHAQGAILSHGLTDCRVELERQKKEYRTFMRSYYR